MRPPPMLAPTPAADTSHPRARPAKTKFLDPAEKPYMSFFFMKLLGGKTKEKKKTSQDLRKLSN